MTNPTQSTQAVQTSPTTQTGSNPSALVRTGAKIIAAFALVGGSALVMPIGLGGSAGATHVTYRFATATLETNPGGPAAPTVTPTPAGVTAAVQPSASSLQPARNTTTWAGYASTPGPFMTASTTFVVPKVGCGPAGNAVIALWAGLDGLSNSSVEQTGVEAHCTKGVTAYRVWTEIFPEPAHYQNSLLIHAGDTVTASASDLGALTPQSNVHSYTLAVTNVTSTQAFSGTFYGDSTEDSSAECILERPYYGTGSPNYGVAHFTACTANDSPINSFPLTPISYVTMGKSPVVEAQPGPMASDTSFTVTRVLTPALGGPITGIAASPDSGGYWLVNAAGSVAAHGGINTYGDLSTVALNAPISHIIATPDGGGYWMVAADGGVFCFGDAPFYGSMGGTRLNKPVVSLAPTPDGKGYWLVASDGGIFAFGDAPFYGSMGSVTLVSPVVGMVADPATGGYWMVAADDGIFSFGAPFLGSTGGHVLNAPVLAISATPSGDGYRTLSSDGGLFSFGGAIFAGSLGGQTLSSPVAGMASAPDGRGYWLVASDGTVTAFNAPFFGSD